jgi:superfamily II DNA or RNA helicase
MSVGLLFPEMATEGEQGCPHAPPTATALVVDSRDAIQAEMIEAIVAQRRAGVRSTVLEAPTGIGKTVCAAKLILRGIEEWDARFLFIVDEKELIRQTEKKFGDWGLRVAVEQAGRRTRDAFRLYGGYDVVVGTRQTLRDQRLRSWRPDEFSDVVIDEAHVGVKGKAIRGIKEHLSGAAFWVALSATPWLANGSRLVPTFFDSTAYYYPLMDYADGRPGAISNGHLVPPLLLERETGVDLSQLRLVMTEHGKDYHQGDLEDLLSRKLEKLVNAAREKIEEYRIGRLLHFCPGVSLAIKTAEAYTKVGISAVAVYGEHPDAARIIQDYHDGKFRVLVVCQMGLKGFDDPPTDGLVMMRPTKSLSLAYQMLGRVLRLSPETDKTVGYVIGFRWESGASKGPVSTLDLFLKDLDEATRKIARKLVDAGSVDGDPPPINPMALVDEAKALARAEAEKRRRDDEAKLRLTIRKRDVKCRTRQFTLARTRQAPRLEVFSGPTAPGMASAEQVRQLVALGLKHQAARMSERDAGRFIQEWDGRAEAGMSSYPQCHYLMRLGYPFREAMELTARQASVEIGRRKNTRSAASF